MWVEKALGDGFSGLHEGLWRLLGGRVGRGATGMGIEGPEVLSWFGEGISFQSCQNLRIGWVFQVIPSQVSGST